MGVIPEPEDFLKSSASSQNRLQDEQKAAGGQGWGAEGAVVWCTGTGQPRSYIAWALGLESQKAFQI